MKNHRRRIRRLLSLLLAAMLAVEPAGTLPAVYAAEDSPETMIMTETDTVGSDHEQESGTPDSGNREEETSGETDMARMWQVSLVRQPIMEKAELALRLKWKFFP